MYKSEGRVLALLKVSSGDMEKENNIKLNFEKVNARKGYLLAKRCIDFIGALCGLILLSPVFDCSSIN